MLRVQSPFADLFHDYDIAIKISTNLMFMPVLFINNILPFWSICWAHLFIHSSRVFFYCLAQLFPLQNRVCLTVEESLNFRPKVLGIRQNISALLEIPGKTLASCRISKDLTQYKQRKVTELQINCCCNFVYHLPILLLSQTQFSFLPLCYTSLKPSFAVIPSNYLVAGDI